MADVAGLFWITSPHVFSEFLFSEEEEILLKDSEEDELVLLSRCCVFSTRKWARISQYFEATVPRYHCDVFRSHFRMTASVFEMLNRLLSTSKHTPKANRFGKPCIDTQKQIVVAIYWALANQESSRQIADRFDVSMSSVSRCLRRVTKALVDNRSDLIQWDDFGVTDKEFGKFFLKFHVFSAAPCSFVVLLNLLKFFFELFPFIITLFPGYLNLRFFVKFFSDSLPYHIFTHFDFAKKIILFFSQGN